jgi:carbon monoxide dehydrogenase subunit G
VSTTITASTWIPAPIHAVFDFFDDPDNVLEFNSGAVRIEHLERTPDGRYVADILMGGRGGQPYVIRSEQLVREPPHRMTIRASGSGLSSEQHREFRTEGAGTEVDVSVTLTYDRRVLGWFLEILQRGQVRVELEAILQEIAERLANRPPPEGA